MNFVESGLLENNFVLSILCHTQFNTLKSAIFAFTVLHISSEVSHFGIPTVLLHPGICDRLIRL